MLRGGGVELNRGAEYGQAVAEDEVPSEYRLIDELGLTVPIGLSLPAGEDMAEIVKTYADCAITAVFCRSDWRTYPRILDPIEIAGGSGGIVGDLRVSLHGPIEPDRDRIKVSFEGFAPWDEGVRIPVDRARTAPFDRYLSGAPPHREFEGVTAKVVDVRVGLLRTSLELHVQATDRDILALQLDRSPFRPYVQSGPGDAGLWRDWHALALPTQHTERREKRGRVTATASASLSMGFRRLTPEEIAAQPPRKDPPPEWSATAQPGAISLAMQGASGQGGEPPEVAEIRPTLYCAALPESATSIDLSLDRLWAYRYDHARAVVPAPRSDRPADLSGITLDGATCRVRLLRWESTEREFALTATCDPPENWPDVRVMAGASSASLWTAPPEDDDELRFGLPLSYSPLFEGDRVELALRMVARRVTPITFHLPLTAAGEGTPR